MITSEKQYEAAKQQLARSTRISYQADLLNWELFVIQDSWPHSLMLMCETLSYPVFGTSWLCISNDQP